MIDKLIEMIELNCYCCCYDDNNAPFATLCSQVIHMLTSELEMDMPPMP